MLTLPPIADLTDTALAAALQHKIDRKTVPHGALGRVGALAQRLGAILGSTSPRLQAPQLVVFAADHGIAARGVSAYPSDVTWQMVGNLLAGGAAASVLARQHGIAQTVVDCGVRYDFDPAPGLVVRKIAAGTQDCSRGPAMSAAQCAQALHNGIELVRGLPGNALLLGEMGIGNTSAASLLAARLGGVDVAEVTGAGTGLDTAGVARKTAVLREALAANAAATAPLDALAALGGFEIATMVGAVLQAASERRVVLVDGFIASAAVLVASRLAPHVLQRCVFAHQSDERGHALLLQRLGTEPPPGGPRVASAPSGGSEAGEAAQRGGTEPPPGRPKAASAPLGDSEAGEAAQRGGMFLPLLALGLRVGEGSGAALAWPLLVSACAILNEMASFESAGVSDKG